MPRLVPRPRRWLRAATRRRPGKAEPTDRCASHFRTSPPGFSEFKIFLEFGNPCQTHKTKICENRTDFFWASVEYVQCIATAEASEKTGVEKNRFAGVYGPPENAYANSRN